MTNPRLDNNLLATGQVDVLPDSRAQRTVGAQQIGMAWWVPIYCANCGAKGGMVPEDNCTFAFWLCNNCWETHGAIAGTMAVPDELFWARLKAEQQAASPPQGG